MYVCTWFLYRVAMRFNATQRLTSSLFCWWWMVCVVCRQSLFKGWIDCLTNTSVLLIVCVVFLCVVFLGWPILTDNWPYICADIVGVKCVYAVYGSLVISLWEPCCIVGNQLISRLQSICIVGAWCWEVID